jgi:translation initiation factor IF-2
LVVRFRELLAQKKGCLKVMSRIVEITDPITVGDLAAKLDIPATSLIAELMKNGVMATINERVDFDTAEIVLGEMDPEIELKKAQKEVINVDRESRKHISEDAEPRPPVVAVMGHVDHGKTTLLDKIRGADTVAQEAGGITQHISAYQIEYKDRAITFLDTPGHEAFAALREHGALLTDLVVIVVAADDGIKPQTLEAIRFAQKAGVKIIVAINKIDKPGADSNRVKQQLSEHKLLVEEWGGDIVAVEVSALQNKGIDNLLDMIFLVTDVEDLKADAEGRARGLVIESRMEQGRGATAVLLIESGILRPGNYVVAGGAYGRIRTLAKSNGAIMKKAGPSTPVTVSGFKVLPKFGDQFTEVKSEKKARALADQYSRGQTDDSKGDISGTDLIRLIDKKIQSNELNIVVKADVQGSLQSVIDSLKTLDTDEVAVKIIGRGVGPLTDNDVTLAKTSNAIICGFNVDAGPAVKRLALRDKVDIRIYSVIYELIDDIKEELTKLLPAEIKETELGRLLVKGIFKITKTEVICGGEVTKGKLTAPALGKLVRDGEEIAQFKIKNLKRGPQEAKEIIEGEMCGMSIETEKRVVVQEGDRIEAFTREEVARSL